jgi:hypothetical protein
MTVIKRLKSPVPKLIRKIQRLSGAVGGLGTVITLWMSSNPNFQVPVWVWKVILGATILNYLILQMTKPEDFIDTKNGNTGKTDTTS